VGEAAGYPSMVRQIRRVGLKRLPARHNLCGRWGTKTTLSRPAVALGCIPCGGRTAAEPLGRSAGGFLRKWAFVIRKNASRWTGVA